MAKRLVHPGNTVTGVVHADARRNPFGNLKKEEQKPAEVKPVVAVNPIVAIMERVFEITVVHESKRGERSETSEKVFYNMVIKTIKDHNLRPSNADVLEFVTKNARRMKELCFEGTASISTETLLGIFLSAIVNMGSNDSYLIDLTSSDLAIHALGFRNRKNLNVYYGKNDGISIDDTGVGAFMRSGTLTINECFEIIGKEMSGGTIIINARFVPLESIGDCATGGSVRFPSSEKRRIVNSFSHYISDEGENRLPGVSIFAGDECVYTPGDYI